MNEIDHLTELDAATAYAAAWNRLDCTHFLELLAPDAHYASQRVFEELESKAAISDYLTGKMQAVRNSKTPVFVAARRLGAYVWQTGRFDGDVDFWRSGLSQPDDVTPVKAGQCLSFSLSTDKDFQCFRQAATTKLLDAKWTETPSDDESDGEADIS